MSDPSSTEAEADHQPQISVTHQGDETSLVCRTAAGATLSLKLSREEANQLAGLLAQFGSSVRPEDPQAFQETPFASLENPGYQFVRTDRDEIIMLMKGTGLRPLMVKLAGANAYNLCADLGDEVRELRGFPDFK